MYRRCSSTHAAGSRQPGSQTGVHKGAERNLPGVGKRSEFSVVVQFYILFFEICILYFNFFHVLFVLLLHRTQGAGGAAGEGGREGGT